MSYPIIFEMFKSGDCSKLYSKECYFHTMKLSNSLRFNVLVDALSGYLARVWFGVARKKLIDRTGEKKVCLMM